MKNKIVTILVCILLVIMSGFTVVASTNDEKQILVTKINTGKQIANTLISESGYYGNRVIEVNSSGTIIWDKSGLYSPADAERLDNGNTLIAEHGKDRVIEVDPSGAIVWEIPDLDYPSDVERLNNGNTLICETNNNWVIEVDPSGAIVWNKAGLYAPADAERLDNGNTLIVETDFPRVIEVDPSGAIVWQNSQTNRPIDAERLDNGNTLICDYFNDIVIEFDSSGNIVWQKHEAYPADAERLSNGNTLITDCIGCRVIEVDSTGAIVWELSGLNLPCDAERICMTQLEIGDIKGGFGVSSTIKNNGSCNANNVVWEIKFTNGLIFIPAGYSATGSTLNIPSLTDLPISTIVLGIGGILGFLGLIEITVSASADNADYVEKKVSARVFAFIVII